MGKEESERCAEQPPMHPWAISGSVGPAGGGLGVPEEYWQ